VVEKNGKYHQMVVKHGGFYRIIMVESVLKKQVNKQKQPQIDVFGSGPCASIG